MKKIFQFILKKPLVVMVFIVAIFFSASIGLKNFKLDASSDALVIEGDEAFKIYRETGEIFGNSEDQQDEAILVIKQGLVDHSFVAEAEINLSATLIKLARL